MTDRTEDQLVELRDLDHAIECAKRRRELAELGSGDHVDRLEAVLGRFEELMGELRASSAERRQGYEEMGGHIVQAAAEAAEDRARMRVFVRVMEGSRAYRKAVGAAERAVARKVRRDERRARRVAVLEAKAKTVVDSEEGGGEGSAPALLQRLRRRR